MDSRGLITIWANDFVKKATDNCDAFLVPSFSQDFYDSIRTFTCRDFEPFDTWAFFANLLNPLAVALMFAGEHLLRYRLHPE